MKVYIEYNVYTKWWIPYACQDMLMFTYTSVAFLVVSNDKGNNTSLGLQISVHSYHTPTPTYVYELL